MRSSSYNTWDWCQHKYFLEYGLGLKSQSNKKADKGTIVHKALELLAQKKLALQKNEATFINDELGKFNTFEMNPQLACELAYRHFTTNTPHHDWGEKDFRDCLKWTYVPLNYNEGMFSPLHREIIVAEKYFDFEIVESWSGYRFQIGNETLEGNLAMKGTLDLIVKHDDGIELIDWKTGLRKNWITGQQKSYDDFRKDAQLRIYYYALRKIMPNVSYADVTIFYTQDGGPITVHFDDDDLPSIEDMIRKRFQRIKESMRPSLIYPNWKCNRLCHFFKHNLNDDPVDSYERSSCKQVKTEILKLGLDRATAKYKSAQHSYKGGGRYDLSRKGE